MRTQLTNEMYRQMPQSDRIEYSLNKHMIKSEYEDLNWFYYSVIVMAIAVVGIIQMHIAGWIDGWAVAHLIRLLIWIGVAYAFLMLAMVCYAIYLIAKLDTRFVKTCFDILPKPMRGQSASAAQRRHARR